jgi:hypothetical protein
MGDDSSSNEELTRDGISEEFFHLMWLKDELNFGPSLNIPDTIVVKYGNPTAWYFTANNGKVRKKNRQNLMNARIEEVFTKNILGYDVLAMFINIYQDVDPDTGVIPPSTVEYLDREGLNQFLYNRPKENSNGILQRFIEPKGTKNELIRAIWSPKVVLVERAENIHHLHDHRYGLYERCVTMEGPEYYYTSNAIRGPVLGGQIQKLCESCVTHISEVTFAQKEVTRMVCNFKVDSRDKIWLLYTTSIRVTDNLEEVEATSSLMKNAVKQKRSLVNIGAAVNIPNTINLNPSRSYDKIVAKQRIRCISCAKETLDDMRHPITYKSIIKHYEHVIHIMTEICANQHTTVLDWPPDPDIIEAAGGIGFGCIDMVADDDILAKSTRMELNKPLEEDELRIPPILRYLHPKLSGPAYFKCRRDPLFLYKTATVCEPCFLVFAEFTTMLLRMGGDLSKLLTPDPAAVNSLNSLHEGSLSTGANMTNGTRPSSADWRAMSTLNRSSSDTLRGHSKEFNPSANHRQAKNTAIGLRTQDKRRAPNMPKAVRKTKDIGPLHTGSIDSMSRTNQSLARSSSLNQIGASQSMVSGGTFEEADIQSMVAERERNFFKEISQNPQLKDQHPLMHLISAQQKLKMVDEQSGVLMSGAAASKESIFGTRYGKQGPDKFQKYGVYTIEQPYIMKGELIKPSKYLQIKAEEKEMRLAAKMERIRRKKARQAEMAASGNDMDGGNLPGASIASEESSVQDITNTKSAKKHRNFLRDSLKGVEQEIIASEKYMKVDKDQVKFAHEHGAFEALTEEDIKKRNLNPELTEKDYQASGKIKKTVLINDEAITTVVGTVDGSAYRGGTATGGSRPGTDRPGTTASLGRPPRSALKSSETGLSTEDMFVGEGSLASGNDDGSQESALLKNWGVEKPLRAEAPALDPSMTHAADSLRNMMSN